MKPLTQRDLDELARYIDDELDIAARVSFEERLGKNELLREKYLMMMEAHQLLKGQRLNMPSKNFTDRVMQNLDHYSPPSFTISIKHGLFLLAGVLIAGALALYLAGSGVFDGTVTISNPVDPSLAQKYLNRSLPSVSVDGKLMVNAIVLLNLGLAWIVLDKTILRPLFRRRMVEG